MKQLILVLAAVSVLALASCGNSPKKAAKEAFDLMMESTELLQKGDTTAASAKIEQSNEIIQEYADDADFCMELSRLTSEKISETTNLPSY